MLAEAGRRGLDDPLADHLPASLLDGLHTCEGTDSGYGTVRIRPIPLRKRYHARGGLGASAAFTLYNPSLDVYLVGTFNQWSYVRTCGLFLCRTLRTVSKVDPVLAAPA